MTHRRAVRFLRADMPALSTNVRFRVISALATEPNGGLIAIASPLVTQKRDLVVSLTNRSRLPTIFALHYYAEAGGLASYGVDNLDLLRCT